MAYLEILLSFLFIVLICFFSRNKNGVPTSWPIVGMLPALFVNLHRINDFFVEVWETQLTLHFKGPWFTNMDILATGDLDNVHHVLCKNIKNYHRGSKFNEIFDVFGDWMANADGHIWQFQRRLAQSLFAHPRFYPFLVEKIWEKVENGLIPVLDHAVKEGLEVDLQDLFSRLTFDTICAVITGCDPSSLHVEFPTLPITKALDVVEEAILRRFTMPRCVWKFQRWLNIGSEKKYRHSWLTIDTFVHNIISRKMEEISGRNFEGKEERNVSGDLLSLYIDEMRKAPPIVNSEKFLRDTVFGFLVAGRDTTASALSWFFYLVAKNPIVLSKIKEELDAILGANRRLQDEKEQLLSKTNFEEVRERLVYLHGAVCETLRLYPPVLFEGLTPIERDILPSGHQVNPNTQIAFNLYAMGRTKSIWGDDCFEFKPERWITEDGKTKYVPSYKFLSFNHGPRNCLGKHLALTQIKVVAATIIQNYHIQTVEENDIVPSFSVILHMKYGFKVKILNTK